MRVAILLVILCVPWTGSAMATSFSSCVADLENAAERAGISRSVTSRALDVAQPLEKVLRLSQAQPEFKTPIWDYLAFLVDEQRVNDGRTMIRTHDDVLGAAERRFGVDRHVIAAVWGVETDYGREIGDTFLPHALATLVCRGGPRTDFWRAELIAALKLVDQQDLDLSELYGSWAGAFGQTQFIPSTYQRLAVDFDGDGRRDLVNSVADALGSTANYLKRAGWRTGEPWMIEVKVPSGYSGPTGRKNRAALSTWAQRGVVRADGSGLSGSAEAGLLLPAGRHGPGFLTFRNFEAIYSYNQAESYALAISHLADRLAGYPPLRTPWPTDDPGLSRAERLDLQKRLLAHGEAIGEADGKIGPVTRAAIAEAEKRFGMPPTGRAGQKIYRALGGKLRSSELIEPGGRQVSDMTSRGWAACGIPFLFSLCYPSGMRRPWEPHRPIRDRKDLVALIAAAVQLYLYRLSDAEAKAVAKCVLQVFKMQGLSIRRRKAVKD